MLYAASDFRPRLDFDPHSDFTSLLPHSSLLSQSLLDTGLNTGGVGGLAGEALRRHMVKRVALDSLHLQQFSLFELATSTGVLSTYADVMRDAMSLVELQGRLPSRAMLEELITTGIGAASSALSAIPNVYAQIAGAVIGLGLMLYDLFKDEPGQLYEHALPMQAYETDTDAGQFNHHVRAVLSESHDYTSLFLPRFTGDLTFQYRADSQGRRGIAVQLGGGGASTTAVLKSSGGLGFVPGGRQITSIMQARALEPPRDEGPPHFDPRCGGCNWSGGAKAVGRDVGAFYPSTNNALLLLWTQCLKPSPVLFALDPGRLVSAWSDYTEAWADGLNWAWSHRPLLDYWGTGMWRCLVAEASRLQTVGVGDVIGALSYGGPQGCDDDYRKSFFRQASLFQRLVAPACARLAEAQRYYLEHTTIAAYVQPAAGYVHGDDGAPVDEARRRILAGPQKYEVRREDVVDRDYRVALRDAGAFDPKYRRTLTLDVSGGPSPRPEVAGMMVSPDAPELPPAPPSAGGGNPFRTYVPRPKSRRSPKLLLGAAAGLGAAALLLR